MINILWTLMEKLTTWKTTMGNRGEIDGNIWKELKTLQQV